VLLISFALQAIVDEVMEEMKIAMKAKDTARLNTIRLIRSSFANAAIDLKTEQLSDEQVRGTCDWLRVSTCIS
jgi:uncharacterized protein YqeY